MRYLSVKKGYDIPLAGCALREVSEVAAPSRVALKATDFPDMKGRLEVQEGSKVNIGTPILTWKAYPQVKFVSPGGGTVSQIQYGERRSLQRIVIELDPQEKSEIGSPLTLDQIKEMPGQEMLDKLCGSGLWPLIVRRPFGKLAPPDVAPGAIFINGMDTAPLAADPMFLVKDQWAEVRAGIEALQRISNCPIYICVGQNADLTAFSKAGIEERPRQLEIAVFAGAHPAGNTGTHMAMLQPLKPKQTFWSLRLQDVALFGSYLLTGRYPHERIVALAGPACTDPRYLKTRQGAPIAGLAGINVVSGDLRYVSGTVLNGSQVESDGYLSFRDHQLTVLVEGKKKHLLGWMLPGFTRLSWSNVYASAAFPFKREWKLDTNLNGAHRPFIYDDLYEDYVGIDIMPVELMKAILAEDFEEMEKLGMLDCLEEDLALCTYICPSKNDFGMILRKGLDQYEKEG